MTMLARAVEQMETPVSGYYLWEIAGKPASIQLSLDLVDRLEKEVIESFKAITKRGSEVGGLLLGRVSAAGRRTVLIEDCELVTCDYNRGPLYLLAEADTSRLESAIQRHKTAADRNASVVGFFRSNTRKDLALDEEDQALIRAYFSGPDNVFLLVKPFSMKPCAAGFFIWEEGQIRGEATYLQFPFKRAELLKGEFAKSIIAGGEKAAAEAKLAAPTRVDGSAAAPAVPKREERVTAPPAAFRREVQAPAALVPPLVPKPEARAPIALVTPKREEPAPPPPPAAPKPEARAPIALVTPKREEPAPPPPVAPKPEARVPIAPVAPKREEPAPPPPVAPKPEARAPIQPVAPKREGPAPSPPIAARREEPAPSPPAAPKPEARTPVQPVVSKLDAKPAAQPVVSKREEPAPPPVPKPEARAPVQPVTPKRGEAAPAPSAAPKPEARAAVQPVTPKREERAPAPPVAPRRDATAPLVPEEPAPFLVAGPSLFQKYRVVGALALLLLVIGIGLWLYFRPRGSKAPEVTAGGPEAGSLLLRAERNAGQLLLSWNREAALVKTASKAVLLISDGDHKEEVELDLGQLRNGSIVYSPVTNDVSFRLEVTDAKQGKSLNESVRVLAGRPSPTPTPTPPTGQTAIPRVTAPAGEAKPRQEPAQPAPAPAKPEDAVGGNSAGAGETASATPAQPPRTMAPIPVAARGAESLTARISQTANLPLPPPLESQATPPFVRAAETSAAPAVAPPPAAVKETPKPAPQPPAPGSPVVDTPPLSATQAPAPPEPLKVGGNVQEAKLIRRTTPIYPPLARQARVTGMVRVEATIGKDGKITRVAAVSGPPLLRQAATDSVRQWIYQPSLLNGQPVEVVTQVDVSFNLGR